MDSSQATPREEATAVDRSECRWRQPSADSVSAHDADVGYHGQEDEGRHGKSAIDFHVRVRPRNPVSDVSAEGQDQDSAQRLPKPENLPERDGYSSGARQVDVLRAQARRGHQLAHLAH